MQILGDCPLKACKENKTQKKEYNFKLVEYNFILYSCKVKINMGKMVGKQKQGWH